MCCYRAITLLGSNWHWIAGHVTQLMGSPLLCNQRASLLYLSDKGLRELFSLEEAPMEVGECWGNLPFLDAQDIFVPFFICAGSTDNSTVEKWGAIIYLFHKKLATCVNLEKVLGIKEWNNRQDSISINQGENYIFIKYFRVFQGKSIIAF